MNGEERRISHEQIGTKIGIYMCLIGRCLLRRKITLSPETEVIAAAGSAFREPSGLVPVTLPKTVAVNTRRLCRI